MKLTFLFTVLTQLYCVLYTSSATPPPLHSQGHISVVSGQPNEGDCTAQFTLGSSGFDELRVSNYNSTCFQWWYFHVVSPDLETSVVVTFWLADAAALRHV